LTLTGNYNLSVTLGGKSVPTALSSPIVVTPAAATSNTTSNFTGVVQNYTTGQSIRVYIQARDQFNNLRGSTNDVFNLYLKGQTTGLVYGPIQATSNLDGSYNVTF
jgi:hypothetical protein